MKIPWISLSGALVVLLIGGCSSEHTLHHEHDHGAPKKQEAPQETTYTCPMHPQIRSDKPGECPICHMKLVPIEQDETHDAARQDSSGVMISPERQQLIGLKTAVATVQPFARTITTTGRVAFDPELAAALQEFVEISKTSPWLKDAAISNLRARGVSDEEIREIGKRPRSFRDLYLPRGGESVWVYATLYQSEVEFIKPGTTAKIIIRNGEEKTLEGVVRGLDPIIDPMSRSARARIAVPGAGGLLRPDAYVNVELSIDLGPMLTIPKSAVIDTGTRKVAFVVSEGKRFASRDIVTGPESAEFVVVRNGISEGEVVAASATFLIDSESQLKAAVSGMGGHQH